jgi:polar amino acid transport system permease protein
LFPQALLIMLPSLGTLLIDLLKNTAVVSLVTLMDITFTAQQLRLTGESTAAVYGLALVVYFALASIVDIAMKFLERRLGRYRDYHASGPERGVAAPPSVRIVSRKELGP